MLEITETKRLGTELITLKGELARENSEDFKSNILQLAENKGTKIILDMWEVDFVDSIGIGALMDVADELEKTGRMLKLYRLNSNVKRVLDSIHLCNKLRVVNAV